MNPSLSADGQPLPHAKRRQPAFLTHARGWISCLSSGILAGLAFSNSDCVPTRLTRIVTPPTRTASLDRRSPYLKAHMRDGSVYVLSTWKVDEAGRTVSGEGQRLDANRSPVATGPFILPLDSVALFETNVIKQSPSVAALSVITGVSAALTGYCALNPKACFGSCPTFYVTDGKRDLLQAEGFSDSVAPALEARDVDALYRARPGGGRVEVRMTNEALETHVVRYVHLLAVPRPAGGRVFATSSGEFWQAREVREPLTCVAMEGDCREAVHDFDGRERFSQSDGRDLATREVIELSFASAVGPKALVIGSRQTLLSTFLLYQGLAYMGHSASDWLARLESGDDGLRRRVHGLRRALGGIEVLVQDRSGRWMRAGEVHETGPLASDVKIVPISGREEGPLRVRLRLARGHWRLDYVALALLSNRVEPLRLRPASVEGGVAGQASDLEGAAGAEETLTTLPGDEYRFQFLLPEDAADLELFLETRGYYLEWMREEWLAEEDSDRLVMLFRDPRRALRVLAPEFKKQEAGMEELFWRSRYAHR